MGGSCVRGRMEGGWPREMPGGGWEVVMAGVGAMVEIRYGVQGYRDSQGLDLRG